MAPPSYENWSREDLITRLTMLDARLPASRASVPKPAKLKPPSKGKAFDFASYPRRKIALKFCYSGWEYNGLVFQNDPTPLFTVEGVLFDALAAVRLIDPQAGPEGCGWERCGRTDRGVSAAGQVVSLWVRSNIGQDLGHDELTNSTPKSVAEETPSSGEITAFEDEFPIFDDFDAETLTSSTTALPSNVLKEEIRYISLLNNVLPATIRIIAWSPVSPSFSSRFSCKHRHYKYFFPPQGLDLPAMRDASSRLVGEHDFRNLCKLDPSKQITSFRRKILRAEISATSALDPTSEAGDMCVFDLVGTAFLYHQVRHIMAILFLVGSGLEGPAVMTALLNTDKNNVYFPANDDEGVPEVVDCKPEYQMADGLPLMLWNCAYDDNDIRWQTDNQADGLHVAGSTDAMDNTPFVSNKSDASNWGPSLHHQLQSIHTRSLIHTALDAYFLRAAAAFHTPPPAYLPLGGEAPAQLGVKAVLKIPVGGGVFRQCGARNYVPLLLRKRLEAVEVVNERWRVGKGRRKISRKANTNEADDAE